MTTRPPFTIPVADGPLPPWLDRALAAAAAAAAASAAVVLWRIAPDPRGFDTHVQLGLQPCGWPQAYGIPCPTCGCTTAACHVVHGDLLRAVAAQPFGAAVALGGLLLGLHALRCLAAGRSFADLLVRLPFWRLLAGMLLLALLAWWYKWATFAT